MRWNRITFVLLVVTTTVGIAFAEGAPIVYPPTRRVDQIDILHGIPVEDPYRWLEASLRDSPEIAHWVEAQSNVTASYLERIPARDLLRRRLTELWNYQRVSPPRKKVAGRFYSFTLNDGLQDQDVVCTATTPDAEPKVLLDPNGWTKGEILAGMEFSPDGKYLAYGVSESGSDWISWKVLDVAARRTLIDDLRWTKFAGVSWAKDGTGFFYSRYPEPKSSEKYLTAPQNQKIYFHRLGKQQADDAMIYERPDQPTWFVGAHLTDDGRYLVIRLAEGGRSSNTHYVYKDLHQAESPFIDLVGSGNAIYRLIGNDGPVFYLQIDLDAPRGRIVAVDARAPDPRTWKTIVPQSDATLLLVNRIGGRLVCNYFADAHTQLKIFSQDGTFVREVPLPGIGTAGGIEAGQSDTEFYFTYLSFATPPTVYRHDLLNGETSLWRKPAVKFDPGDYRVQQIFYASKDGTRVSMFIVHRKGLTLDGDNPTLLHGYGGFNVSLAPDFDPAWIAWLEQGGVLAVANIRGGGEYGQDWHKAAVKRNRQRAYDDFIAAAEYLIAKRYTRPVKLSIYGTSNGGLLAAACMVQRPDLYGACLPDVGNLDMIRFSKFGVGPYTVSEYGSPDDPDEFRALLTTSPYHNLKKGVKYPATLVTTADTDDRVPPMHSFKFAAMLQYCQGGDAPVLLRVERNAGHGGGTTTAQQIDVATDRLAFLMENLGVAGAMKPMGGRLIEGSATIVPPGAPSAPIPTSQ